MAALVDLDLLSMFSGIVVFLLIYAIAWGFLSWRKWPGDQPGVQALIAFSVAFLMAVAPPARTFVMFVAPWYIALAVVIFFALFIVGMFGMSPEKDFPNIIKDGRMKNWIIIFIVLIFVAGLASMFGQSLLEKQTGPQQPVQPTSDTSASNDFGNNLLLTLINPKVMGLLLVIIIAALAIYFLSVPSK